MVAFKQLFLATFLLLGGVTAAPAGVLNVAVAEARAANDLAITSRDINAAHKKSILTKRGTLTLTESNNANQITEEKAVGAMTIRNNHGVATVVDLTGCTAIFFYMGTGEHAILRRAVHIFCGKERADAEQAARAAGGATDVFIAVGPQTVAQTPQTRYDDAKAGVQAGNSHLIIHPQITYPLTGITVGNAVTLTAHSGSTTITAGIGRRVSRQSQPQPS